MDELERYAVRATAVRWVDDEPFPGIVEVQFVEHDGRVVTIHEKGAVIDARLTQETRYPVEVLLDCELLAVSTPAAYLRLHHDIRNIEGGDTFTVCWPGLVDRLTHNTD